MNDSGLQVSIECDVAQITLCRAAKRNALTRELLRTLLNAVRDVASINGLRLVVLRAEGPVFCAGMDLSQMQATAADPRSTELWQADAQLYGDVLLAIWGLEVPTIAAVQGPAVAGGVGLALACDLVLSSESATFSLPEPRRGISAAIVAPLLVHRIGPGPAAHLLLSGKTWDARLAFQRGLCDELVPPAEFESALNSLTASILTGSPAALRLTKFQWRRCAGNHIPNQLAEAVALSAQARGSAEAREGLQAFLEKRQPAWTPTI